MKTFKFNFICCVFIFFIQNNIGQIKVGPLFSDDMILQRNAEVSIWGESNINEKINVFTSWDNNKQTSQSNQNG